MENENIMNNEVVDAAEEITAEGSMRGLIGLGVIVAIGVGFFIYKKGIKPALAKRRAKKEAAMIEGEFEEVEGSDEVDSE